jgi:hypothetical protein
MEFTGSETMIPKKDLPQPRTARPGDMDSVEYAGELEATEALIVLASQLERDVLLSPTKKLQRLLVRIFFCLRATWNENGSGGEGLAAIDAWFASRSDEMLDPADELEDREDQWFEDDIIIGGAQRRTMGSRTSHFPSMFGGWREVRLLGDLHSQTSLALTVSVRQWSLTHGGAPWTSRTGTLHPYLLMRFLGCLSPRAI